MSTATSSTGSVPPGEPEPWQATFTPKEAAKLGVAKPDYERLLLWARMVVEHHVRLGTPRDLWEGNANHNDQFVGLFIEEGEGELLDRLDRDVDPALDTAHGLLEDIRARLDAVAQHPVPVVTPESGRTLSGVEAVALVTAHDAAIDADFRAGRQHHRRVAPWAVTIGAWLPWLEALGLLAFIAYFTNIPLLRPWEDLLGFSLSLTIVAIVIYSETRFVRGSAENHNAAREAAASGNRHEAERAHRRRNLFGVPTAIVAIGFTAGLILRCVAVLGDGQVTVLALLIFLAILTGLLMPTVSYLSIALDGSSISRERDSLAADLDDDHAMVLETTEGCRRRLAEVSEISDTLRSRDVPAVYGSVQDLVAHVYTPYTTARLLIGGLSADPPDKVVTELRQLPDGRVAGEIGTGIPGARTVNLSPLVDRIERLVQLDQLGSELHQRLAALPPHPWTTYGTP